MKWPFSRRPRHQASIRLRGRDVPLPSPDGVAAIGVVLAEPRNTH